MERNLKEPALNNQSSPTKSDILNGFSATSLGVGAIVGGGILLLVGPAFKFAGPAIIVAFLINFLVTLSTAYSMYQLGSLLPESGGAYLWARKLWSVNLAFPVGWLIWLSSVLAGALNAIGIGFFLEPAFHKIISNSSDYAWIYQLVSPFSVVFLTLLVTLKGSSGNATLNLLKMFLFILFFILAFSGSSLGSAIPITQSMKPFAPHGWGKVLLATGLTLVAFQGFEVIANVSGRIKNPKTLMTSMIGSLSIALVIYLPLVIILCFATFNDAASSDMFIADVVENFGGTYAWWVVICCGVLAMYLAIEANLVSASAVFEAMAQDGTLFTWMAKPKTLSNISGTSGSKQKSLQTNHTSSIPIIITGLVMLLLTWGLGDIETAASTASFSFVLLFGFANLACIYVGIMKKHSILQLLVSIFGASGCLSIAVILLHGSWSGPLTVAIALIVGCIIYTLLLARRAHIREVFSQDDILEIKPADLVMVPVSNPTTALNLIELGHKFVDDSRGKIILLSVIQSGTETDNKNPISVSILPELDLSAHTESLIVTCMENDNFWNTIAKAALDHKAINVVIGLGENFDESEKAIKTLLTESKANVSVVRPGKNFSNRNLNILVPISPYFANRVARARVLKSFLIKEKDRSPNVTFLRVYSENSNFLKKLWQKVINWKAKRSLQAFASDCGLDPNVVSFEKTDKVEDTLTNLSNNFDILILGLPPQKLDRPLLTPLIQKILNENKISTILLICSR